MLWSIRSAFNVTTQHAILSLQELILAPSYAPPYPDTLTTSSPPFYSFGAYHTPLATISISSSLAKT